VFTGLVEDVGRIARQTRRSDAVIFGIAPSHLPCAELAVGDSVAVSGVCLTVTEIHQDQFTVLAGAETLGKTTLGDRRIGDRVNLERALRMGDRLGGHMVSGHVDGVGELTAKRDEGANVVLTIRPPEALLRYVIEKGSIAIDGISLTVNSLDERELSVALIPHTVEQTTLADRTPGSKVNLEVDMIGKYVEKLVAGYQSR